MLEIDAHELERPLRLAQRDMDGQRARARGVVELHTIARSIGRAMRGFRKGTCDAVRAGMATTVGDHIVERLIGWGVRTIFGYPGDGINGVVTALDRAKEQIRFIQV